MKFTKMHGIGNDYIYIDTTKEKVLHPEKLAVELSRPHFGIGSDGLVLIMPSEKSGVRMRMFNPDGTEAEMCGNASRCVAKYAYEKGLVKTTTFTLETKSGEKDVCIHLDKNGEVESVTIDMGMPILEPELIPVAAGEKVLAYPLEVNGNKWSITCVSMGNPHCVIFVDDVENFDVHGIGREIEKHPFFPRKTNVEFVEIVDKNHVKMRVWERGTGETLACGTGACATLVASALNRFTAREATISLLGGDLYILWDEKDNHVYMTGGATTVFEGDIKIKE